jgi:predicted amidohydrolase YtcJ
MDGALGSHGAWLLEPYEDMPSTAGLNTSSIDSIRRSAEIAAKHGFQVNTHAIGDRGNRETLDIYEEFLATTDDPSGQRWRIEHSQHLHPADIPRFGRLGVIPAMQAVHATSDGPWVPKRLGEQRAREGAYVWQSLWKSGAVVTNGTDAPVEDVNPLPSFYASVTRRLNDGTVFYPEEALSRQQALEAYTINNAYAAFQEDKLGSLTPGKWADIVVLSEDIMTVPDAEILDAKVVLTIVGGKVVYERPAE